MAGTDSDCKRVNTCSLNEIFYLLRLSIRLMTSFYYENRDIPDMTTYKATRMAFDSLLYPYRDPEKMF